MTQNLKIEGIYDLRTLKLLKSKGLKDFGFNFSPKSFNFVQEYVLLEQLTPILEPSDRLHLHFVRDNDPMISKAILDLSKAGIDKENIFLYCDEWSELPAQHQVNYFLNYYPEINPAYFKSQYFSGLVFDFNFFEDLHHNGILNNFVSNFYTHFEKILDDDKKIVLKIDWNSNVMPSLFDYFEFDLVSFSINSKIEVCYRNVDLKKLTEEMVLIEKNRTFVSKF